MYPLILQKNKEFLHNFPNLQILHFFAEFSTHFFCRNFQSVKFENLANGRHQDIWPWLSPLLTRISGKQGGGTVRVRCPDFLLGFWSNNFGVFQIWVRDPENKGGQLEGGGTVRVICPDRLDDIVFCIVLYFGSRKPAQTAFRYLVTQCLCEFHPLVDQFALLVCFWSW